jgi:hypothetical protein
MINALPEVGKWFKGADGTTFEVVAVDRDDLTIEVQHYDGTVEEFDVDSWREMQLQPTPPPEDWTGSMDVDDEDRPGNDETHQSWGDPLEFVDEYDEGE